MKEVLIIIPAYNEQDNIKRVVDNLIENYPQYDYVVVNDGSRDHTRRICRENGYRLLDLPVNLGLAGGFQAGMKYAYRAGYKYAIQVDADGQHRPEYIEPIKKKMEEGYDIVIASRFVSKKKPFSMRMLGSRLISAAIKITTGKRIKDPTSGMRMFNRRIIKECATNIQAEMDERIAGQSYLTAFKSISYMVRMLTSILVIQNFRKRR